VVAAAALALPVYVHATVLPRKAAPALKKDKEGQTPVMALCNTDV
jgi:hypothetical protein